MNFLCSFLHLVFFFPCNQEEEPEEIKEVNEEVMGRGWDGMDTDASCKHCGCNSFIRATNVRAMKA